MDCKKLVFSGHALVQMFKRGIHVADIEKVMTNGIHIKEYPYDKPYPSFLVLGFNNNRPLHIVAAIDKFGNCYIITAYEPDVRLWDDNFTNKKQAK